MTNVREPAVPSLAVADTCPHGFPLGDCLICQTLRASSGQSRNAPPPGSYAPPAQPPPLRGGPGAPRGQAVRPDVVYEAGTSAKPGRPLSTRIGLILVLLALVMIAAWVVAGALFAIFRLFEILIVAAAAGWVGYRLGVRRGRRSSQ